MVVVCSSRTPENTSLLRRGLQHNGMAPLVHGVELPSALCKIQSKEQKNLHLPYLRYKNHAEHICQTIFLFRLLCTLATREAPKAATKLLAKGFLFWFINRWLCRTTNCRTTNWGGSGCDTVTSVVVGISFCVSLVLPQESFKGCFDHRLEFTLPQESRMVLVRVCRKWCKLNCQLNGRAAL